MKGFGWLKRGSKAVVTAPIRVVKRGRDAMVGQLIGSVVRTCVAAFGGTLVANGYASGDDLTAAAGALTTVITLAWSIWQKTRAAKG